MFVRYSRTNITQRFGKVREGNLGREVGWRERIFSLREQ